MKANTIGYVQINILVLFVFILLFAGKCNRGLRAVNEENAKKEATILRTKNLIKTVQGIPFTEVSRKYNNGLSFSPVGFQLLPEWRISFPSADSVRIYSPKLKKYVTAPVVFDHDSIFNIAWAWVRLRYINKDSLQFMVLHVHNNIIKEEKAHVFMTFYSNSYIKNVLHADTANIWKPSSKDTLYIKTKTLQARQIPDSAFAGTQTAVLKSKSKFVTVKKKDVDYEEDDAKTYDSYLSPSFDIIIHHAYDDFKYLYTAYVDEKGNLTFRKSTQFMYPEYVKPTVETMKAITDGYLKLYLDVKPGKTLGIPHKSIVFLNVTGFKK
jgi:hypothetical protein